MKHTIRTDEPTPGFAIRLTEDTDLGNAMLIIEDEGGAYLPIALVGTITEARESAADDLRRRMAELERGGEPLCPKTYKVWARGLLGVFAVAAEFDPSQF